MTLATRPSPAPEVRRAGTSPLQGVFGRPFVTLDDLFDLPALDEIDDEICLALARMPTGYTGGSHRSMKIMPRGCEAEALVDYQEVIRGLHDAQFEPVWGWFHEQVHDGELPDGLNPLEIVESIQSDGKPRTDLDLDGLTIFIAPVAPDAAIPSAPIEPYIGLDHFGLRVDNMDEAVAELKRRGAHFKMEPRTIRPGVKIAFIEAPDNVRIELLERT